MILVSIYCCAKTETPGRFAEDELKISDLEIEFSKAIEAKDLDKLVSLYADNGALYFEQEDIKLGRNAIRESWKADFARPGLTLSTEPRTVEISNAGNLAWAHGLFIMNQTEPGRTPQIESWDYALVYTKQPDGKWQIMADSANCLLRNHLFRKPSKSTSPYAPLAPLIGLFCFFSSVLFLLCMPVLALVSGWKLCRKRRLSTAFLIAVVTFIAYFATALLLWGYISGRHWNLPFNAALAAAVDTARYGNPVEDTSEGVLVMLLVLSTFSAVTAGVIAGTTRWLRIRCRRAAI